MSKITTSILVFLLAAFAWFGWLSFRATETNANLTKSLVVVQMTGSAGVENGLTRKARQLKIGTAVGDHEQLSVSPGGIVDLASPDGSRIRIEGPARVKVDTLNVDNNITALQVLAGSFKTFVSKAAGSGSYLLKTNSAVAGVRGTVFSITVDENGTTLAVAEGKVEFKNNQSDGSMILVPAGSQIGTAGSGYSEVVELDQIQKAQLTLVKDIAAAELPTLTEQIVSQAKADAETVVSSVLALVGQSGGWEMPSIELPELTPSNDGQSGQSIQAQIDMKMIFNELSYAYIKNGTLPESIDLSAKDIPTDPWSELYQYERLSSNEFKLYSKGEDKVAGSADDVVFPRSKIQ